MCSERVRATWTLISPGFRAERIVLRVQREENLFSLADRPIFRGKQRFVVRARHCGIVFVEPADRSRPLPPTSGGRILRLMNILVRWLLLAAALLLVAEIYPGVRVSSFGAAMIAALVLGLLNALVRPFLV